MKILLRIITGLIVILFIFFQSSTISLTEGLNAVVTHFGNPDRIIKTSGLHYRYPWPIDNVYYFDVRKRIFNTRFTQTLTRDKRSIILMSYVVWKIENPLTVLQTMGDKNNAENKLDGLISSAKNNVMGNYNLDALVSTDKSKIKINEIESKILDAIYDKILNKFGIKILQIGIKRIAFPKNNTTAIFDQMKAERAQYAAKYRAEGRMEASKIRSDTELEVAKINAKATEISAEIRGKTDKEASEIYATAHKQGKDFYRIKRSLDSMEKLVDNNGVFIIRSDEAPFDVLKMDKTGGQKID